MYSLHLAKPRFKFSSSHFTIFSEDEAERLHGHNYRVQIKAGFDKVSEDTGLAIDFNEIKDDILELCETLDEKILIPTESPYLEIGEVDKQVEVKFKDQFYSFPKDDCHFLDLRNICTEELALWFWHALKPTFAEKAENMTNLAVTITETQGQAVTYSQKI